MPKMGVLLIMGLFLSFLSKPKLTLVKICFIHRTNEIVHENILNERIIMYVYGQY